MRRLLDIMARLRDPVDGCPWDREQDWSTIAPHTIEEAYEVEDAISRDDAQALRDELGDLLFQVVFHARIAEERGEFDFDAVADAIADKLERRHPHVFGAASVASAADQSVAWEAHKAAERTGRGTGGALDGVALGLPALTRADKLNKRAARVGFDWPNLDGVLAKLDEERVELLDAIGKCDKAAIEHEVGDALLAMTNVARKLGVDPEAALRAANRRFETRFRAVEAGLAADGKSTGDVGLDDLEARWQRAKRDVQE